MNYKIGKVYNYDDNLEVGYIMTDDNSYMFLKKDSYEDIQNGDIVKFKGEEVYNSTYKAFFIKKIDNIKNQS